MKNTAVAFVLDESGSMSGKEQFIQSSFKEQATVLRETKKAGKITATMVKFGSAQEESKPFVAFAGKAPSAFSLPEYKPCGNTALCDAVAMAIETLETKAKSNTAFLVTVFTDGEENASQKWNGRQLAGLIKEKQDTGKWTFSFIGPHTKDVGAWGIPAGNIYTYSTMADANAMTSSAMSTYVNLVRVSSFGTTALMTTAATYISK